MLQENKAHSLVEGLIVLGISVLIFGIILVVYISFQRSWTDTSKQIEVQSSGRIAMQKMADRIRRGSDVRIFNNGNRLEIDIDTDFDGDVDDTDEYKLQGNEIIYNPGKRIIARKVIKKPGLNLFTQDGRAITINFSIWDENAADGNQWIDLTSAVKLRN